MHLYATIRYFTFLLLLLFTCGACQQKQAEVTQVRNTISTDTTTSASSVVPPKKLYISGLDSVVRRILPLGDVAPDLALTYRDGILKKVDFMIEKGDYGSHRTLLYFSDGQLIQSYFYSKDNDYQREGTFNYTKETKYDFKKANILHRYDSLYPDSFDSLAFITVDWDLDSAKVAQTQLAQEFVYIFHTKGTFSYLFHSIEDADSEGYELTVSPLGLDIEERIMVKDKDDFIDSLQAGKINPGDTIQLTWYEAYEPDNEIPIKRYKTRK